MINFRKAFETIFKSFDISGDTKLINKMESEGLRFLMLVKRHWLYGVIHSWRVLFVAIIAVINSYLLLFSGDKYNILGIIFSIFLILNVIHWVIIIVIYLSRFYKINGKEPHVEDIYTVIRESEEADDAFTSFFNQTLFLLISLIVIVAFSIMIVVNGLLGESIEQASYGVLNIFLLLAQVGLFYSYLGKMLDLEMDFKIVIPNQIIFYNQRGLLGNTQTMNADKIKTMNTKYSGFFGSFFNYGDIILLTEGSDTAVGEMVMDFTGNPTRTVKEMKKVLDNDLALIEKEVNVFLKKVEKELGIKDIDTLQNREKLKKFMDENNSKIKEMYEKGDDETKREIKQIYVILAHN